MSGETHAGGSTVARDDGVYRIRAGEFEGPLDLLLHLVRANEVDITDIPIVEITAQYSEYLQLMRDLDLEVAGEYLVMASTLMHIKSRMLLPAEPVPEGEEPEDPRAELAQQLLEYQRFKQAAESLQALDSMRGLVWTREGRVPEEFAQEELLVVDLFDLLSAFRSLLGRLDEEARLQLKRDNVSVADKIHWLSDLLDERGSADFEELMETLPSRLERIATFLAMLEMIRLQMLVVFQRKALGRIRLALRPGPEDGGAPASAERGAEPPGGAQP